MVSAIALSDLKSNKNKEVQCGNPHIISAVTMVTILCQ